MKINSLLLLVVISLAGCTTVSAGQTPVKISEQLWQKVQNDGMARVSVSLNVPTIPEAQLTQAEVIAQRQAIGDAQNRLLKELDGTKYQRLGMLTTIPGMGLTVGADALAVLGKSVLVSEVTEYGVPVPLNW